MSTATKGPLQKFRLLSGGYDQFDPAFESISTAELRKRVLEKRDVSSLDDEDKKTEVAAVNGLTRPELLKELGAYQRFRADAATGVQPIVESREDLISKWGRSRFDSIGETTQERIVERVVLDLDDMSLEELIEFASEEEIEIPEEATSKAKVLSAIRSARRAKVSASESD